MGFDTIVVAFFVIGTIVVVVCALTTGANNLIKTSYEGYTASSQTIMDRLHTDIKVNNITFDGYHNCFNLTVENTGETKLTNFDLWDVIVVKNGENNQASYLKKDDNFSLTFTSNFINPGILDPRETIDISIDKGSLPELESEDSLYIKVITENGISSSINYTMS
jgi:flagellar protein FlaF